MSLEEKYKIPLFDGSNYNNWKYRMEILLEELELKEFIQTDVNEMIGAEENDSKKEVKEFIQTDVNEMIGAEENDSKKEDFLKRDRKCKSHIIMRIADSHLEYVKDQHTAFDMWNILSTTFTSNI
ncbi:hypothetical protein QE152_g8491 [Popillia japonica]|uniref:DUF4219 domain-containing protein n=1 Tax=Popillia japonica TaxID=7064 RepID=A0AAW1M301_POPJA